MAEVEGVSDVIPINETPETEELGRRERKPVQRLEATAPVKPKEKPSMTKAGSGVKLREIDNIAFRLSKAKGSDDVCRVLHLLLFRRAGKKIQVKRNILEFSGFVYADAEKEREKDKVKLFAQHKPMIHAILDILDLERGSGKEGTKESQVDRILNFLDKPMAAAGKKDLAALAEKKKNAKKRKIERKKKVESKRSSKKMKAAKEEEEEEDEEDDEDDDVPLVQMKLPSDKAIESQALQILKGADLNEVTMKDIREQLSKHFKVDMSSKKGFIKEVVTKAIEEGF